MRGNHKHSFKDVRFRKNLLLRKTGLLLGNCNGRMDGCGLNGEKCDVQVLFVIDRVPF